MTVVIIVSIMLITVVVANANTRYDDIDDINKDMVIAIIIE